MNNEKKTSVKYINITEEEDGQRVDNFLMTRLKGVPKSHIYRLLRKGEVRVNKKRIDPSDRLIKGDTIRLPPLFLAAKAIVAPPSQNTASLLKDRILYEDDCVLIINKPAGMSVHAGSTVRMGVVEALRHIYPNYPHLELAHRLDSETSGCLILAKRKKILRELHTLLRAGEITKIYTALTKGHWKRSERQVCVSLHKEFHPGGKHVVVPHKEGKVAKTYFEPIQLYQEASLVKVQLFTGRTHQIRVHSAHQDHPIALDDRYGDMEFNKFMRQKGLKRMFLHATSIDFVLPSLERRIRVVAPLDPELEAILKVLQRA